MSDKVVVAKQSSPLAIGLSDGATLIASDATPFVGYTDRVIYLRDGEMAVISGECVDVMTIEGKVVQPRVERLSLSVEEIEKGGMIRLC